MEQELVSENIYLGDQNVLNSKAYKNVLRDEEEDSTSRKQTREMNDSHRKYGAAAKKISTQRQSESSISTDFTLESSRVDINLLNQSSMSQQSDIQLNFGTHIPFCWIKGVPFFTIGPHWPFTVILSSIILISGTAISELLSANNPNEIWYYGEYGLMILVLLFFTIASLKNPGIALPQNKKIEPQIPSVGQK